MTDQARAFMREARREEGMSLAVKHLDDLLAECERLRAALKEERRKRHLWAKGQFWWGARGGRR